MVTHIKVVRAEGLEKQEMGGNCWFSLKFWKCCNPFSIFVLFGEKRHGNLDIWLEL